MLLWLKRLKNKKLVQYLALGFKGAEGWCGKQAFATRDKKGKVLIVISIFSHAYVLAVTNCVTRGRDIRARGL